MQYDDFHISNIEKNSWQSLDNIPEKSKKMQENKTLKKKP